MSNAAIFSLIFPLLLGVAYYLHKVQSNKIVAYYQKLVSRYGGQIKGHTLFYFPKYSGQLDSLSIHVHSVHGGKNRPPYTHVKIEKIRELNFRLEIYKESFLGKIGKSLGLQDVEVNNPSFDVPFIIKCDSAARLHSVLTPELQEKILKLAELNPKIKFEDETALITIPSIPKEPSIYLEMVDCLLNAANNLK